ncbi:MAG TPA: DUF4126 domain-containing protein [Candidatus Paceibacterota bacterium]|nr:DUF4126 domain-containing protein [Verrucomicrobiota bacterium]HOX00737.1 DUF4126 domain-containing protein [Verrucomicrobiota bacterium]HRZ45717.1 DUF4126 domain-containing protein [Candidatus Paceibacterota bacterium]HRZ94059.1 DUF4126 domain-containing protein [Candidatus Paceibacterota bacterium]
METVLCICLGIGLSAACGFRVFVPMLVMSIASLAGHLSFSPEFQWIGTYPALILFSVATAAEVAGYYVPWVDHALDVIATPAAIVAGVIVSAAIFTGMSPLLKWPLAIIAGGGVAGLVQGATVMTRTAALAGSGGLANPVVATMELGGAVASSIGAIVAPLLFAAILAIGLALAGRKLWRWRQSRASAAMPGGAWAAENDSTTKSSAAINHPTT